MTQEQYRKRWLRQHKQYERLAYKELVKGFRDLGNSIPFIFMTSDNYEDFLNTNVTQEQFINIYYNIYKEVGLIHGARVGRTINKQIKDFTLNSFISEFERNLLSWLFDNVTERIVTVRKTYLEYIRDIITFGLNDGKTISQITTELTKKINQPNFYRWQALRIARTETTASANYSALVSGEVSGVVMDKIWISAVDARTRRPPKSEYNHIVMNGVKVLKNESFKVPFNGKFENMQYAGDPKGSAGNVINCRCTIGFVPRRDKNGRIVRT